MQYVKKSRSKDGEKCFNVMYIHQTGEYTISMQVRFYRYERKRKYKIS